VLSWRRNKNGGLEMKAKLITIFIGLFIAVAAWVPLWIVEARDPYAMPVGLGLFAFAASFVGGVTALVGVIGLVIHASRASKARS
jgi:hypothetical protein